MRSDGLPSVRPCRICVRSILEMTHASIVVGWSKRVNSFECKNVPSIESAWASGLGSRMVVRAG
jgi:hypothetical protein